MKHESRRNHTCDGEVVVTHLRPAGWTLVTVQAVVAGGADNVAQGAGGHRAGPGNCQATGALQVRLGDEKERYGCTCSIRDRGRWPGQPQLGQADTQPGS